MDNEISKMFENAGVNKNCHANIKFDDCIYSPSDCGYYNYPDFTAEKQLELIKFCFDKYGRFDKVRGLKERCIIYYRFDKDGYTEFVNCETWEEAIAGLINNLWQSLTDQEKDEIRRILK